MGSRSRERERETEKFDRGGENLVKQYLKREFKRLDQTVGKEGGEDRTAENEEAWPGGSESARGGSSTGGERKSGTKAWMRKVPRG